MPAATAAACSHSIAILTTAAAPSVCVLRYLYGVLVKEPVISASNKGRIVEVLRSIAELIIWGDQHSPAFFDFFAGQRWGRERRRQNCSSNDSVPSADTQLNEPLSLTRHCCRRCCHRPACTVSLFREEHSVQLCSHLVAKDRQQSESADHSDAEHPRAKSFK